MFLRSVIKKIGSLGIVVGSLALLQGCLDDSDVYDPNEFFERDMEAIEQYITDNNINAQYDSLNSIYYVLHKEGDGYRTIRFREVELHYRGQTLNGNEFVNTFTGLPERIFIGATRGNPGVNPANYAWGLDDWLLSHRKEGDSLTIFLPSAYAFEDQGYASVPPNTPVVYTVKYEDILLLSEDLQKIDQYIEDKSWTSTIEPSYGTRVVVHEAGDPDVEVNFGDFISVRYEGRLLDDTVFDSNFDDPSALNFTLGGSDFTPVAGFEMGLNELNEKDSATFFIPSIYGYGEDGNQSAEIPGNAPLAFTIKVENVTKSQQ